MIGRIWLPSLVAFAFILGTAGAGAQTVGPDEAVNANGAVVQKLALTEAQKSAIYNAVRRQRPRVSTATVSGAIPVAVGAPVSPAATLADLPDQAAANEPWAAYLKYAMVEDDVVVVDPIGMRVVGIIHGSTKP